MDQDITVIIRELESRPAHEDIDKRFQVELHDGDQRHPLGIAFVSTRADDRPLLEYVFVADHCRRRGLGTKLILETRKRWPDVELTDAICIVGERLIRAYVRTVSDEGGVREA